MHAKNIYKTQRIEYSLGNSITKFNHKNIMEK